MQIILERGYFNHGKESKKILFQLVENKQCETHQLMDKYNSQVSEISDTIERKS